MRQFAIAIAAALCMSTAVMAQTTQQDNKRQRPNSEQRVQMRTERMVERYGLNQEQAAKLQALNKEYEGKMGPRHRHGGPRHDGQRPPRDVKEKRTDMKPQQREGRGPRPSAEMMQQMKADREAYDAKLSKIMTPKQFEQYQQDEAKMKEHHGQRMGKPADGKQESFQKEKDK